MAANKQQFIAHHIDELFRYWLVQATGFGSIIFLLLSGIDYLGVPDQFGRFFVYRVIAATTLAAIALISHRSQQRTIFFHQVLAYCAVIASALAIELMILQFGGHRSPYYVGMILLSTCVLGFMPGRFGFYVIAAALIYALYLIPILMVDSIDDTRAFLIANVFIVFILFTLLTIKRLSERRLISELELKYALSQQQSHLEELVSQRTRDISEVLRQLRDELDARQTIDRQLADVNEQLRQSQKMEAIGLLAGGIAHDFGNILTTMKGCGHLLKTRLAEDDPLRKYVDQILSSSGKASELIQNLLAFSRRQVITTTPLDLNEVVRQVASLLSRVIGEDIRLSVTLHDDRLPVMADASQLHQVLLNLATNARDAMPQGGRLEIRTEWTAAAEAPPELRKDRGGSPFALVTVSDTGSGIAEEARDRIFEPFFTTKPFGKGSGIGLAIAYGIVKQHGGFITVDSYIGRGTTFRIYLPLTEKAISWRQPAPLPLQRHGAETILLAEDDPEVRHYTAEVLRQAGYTVHEAQDGSHAVDVFRRSADEISLVILDIIMPEKGGLDAFREMNAIRPGSPVLFLSGYVSDQEARETLSSGGYHFCSKTAEPDVLLQRIRDILGAAQAMPS